MRGIDFKVLGYCREGYESIALRESVGFFTRKPFKTDPPSKQTLPGLYEFRCSGSIEQYLQVDIQRFCFTRQLMLSIGELFGLPEENRADPIAESAENFFSKFELPKLYSELSIEHPDAETGKVLSKFCRSIERAIENRLRKRGFKQVFKTLNTPIPKLHILFKSYDSCYIAISRRNLGIGWPCGIPRLRFDKDAPSRSALKLEEALMVFLSAQQRERLVGTGTTAVDLGAAPGGWTYVFHKRGSQVTAIDNGRLDAKLFADGRIKHLQEDAFRYKPNSPVDWLLCDVIESPFRITELIAEWFTRGLCTRAIVNLKLPMKDKLDCVNECIARLEEINNIRICAKHLYHDRDEITVFLSYV